MNLIRWKELDSLDKLMNNFFGQDYNVNTIKCPSCHADVYMKENNIMADIDMPGIDPKDVEITIEGNYLKITGKRHEENEVKEQDFYRKEIIKGSFERYIPLPTDQIDDENIKAVYKKGVLQVTVPKKEEEKKRIEIKVESE
ncbi:MAG: Hsp20/alpha crystallin family protein [Candidatus Delongbacteria bacterium]|nr:Hsp20/alpha crystallin family protein [Candidatus Delongbacteria bacterium]MDD4205429.1 Hsp20/alpha crystallin family protein [Candidatus Delongbacteria bacterium]